MYSVVKDSAKNKVMMGKDRDAHEADRSRRLAELLHGLNIIPDVERANITVKDRQGQFISAEMKSVPVCGPLKGGVVDMSDLSTWPLYMRNRERFYWFEYLPDAKTIYFNYNSCQIMPAMPFDEFSKELFDTVDQNPVEKLVIELRNNGGGNSRILSPFIEELAKVRKINQKGRLFVVIGRQTFSSAILNAINLKKQTLAVFVGEPTRRKPNHFGELRFLTLPNMKLIVSYSTKYFEHSDVDTPSPLPDFLIEMSIEDYRQKCDPMLDAILSGKY